MRKWINLIENTESQAEIYISAANDMLARDFSGKIHCMLGAEGISLVEIEDISANETGQGWGTKAMTALCDLADEMQIGLTLGVANETDDYYDTEDDDLPSEEDLINFYSRFGFEIHDSFGERIRMDRSPV